MDDNILRSKILQYLHSLQQQGVKQTSSIEVYRNVVEEYPMVSFSTIDSLLSDVAKVHSLQNSRIHTKFISSDSVYEEYVIVFLDKELKRD